MSNESPRSRYFAYGSNLWIDQMIQRVGSACIEVPPEKVRLPNYRLVFNMQGESGAIYANIASPGEGVLGVVYECTDEALAKLDIYETGYDRVFVEVLNDSNQALPAIAYIAKPSCTAKEPSPPSEQYLWRIVTGARQQGLPEEYVAYIIQTASKQ